MTQQPEAAERRAYMRWSTVGAIALLRLPGREPLVCELRNISAGGAGVVLREPIPPGVEAVLEVSPNMRLPARILRSGPNDVGLEFRIDEATRARIHENITLGLSPRDW
jgi:c-di-GMP-binding flagellar brake protein YcgR